MDRRHRRARASWPLVVWLMYRSWRRRAARDESLSSYPLPESLGAPALAAEALYVATTPAGEPLERLAVRGLGFRAPRTSRSSPGGWCCELAGESTTFIPADRARRRRRRASWTRSTAASSPTGSSLVTLDAVGRRRRPPRRQLPSRPIPGDAARIIRAVNDIAAAPAASRPNTRARPRMTETPGSRRSARTRPRRARARRRHAATRAAPTAPAAAPSARPSSRPA